MGDLLYQFTDWLRTTQLIELSLWISEQPLSLWLVTHFWAIPTLQTIHILAIAAAFGAVLMMSLRILELAGGTQTIAQTTARFLPWAWWGLAALIITGLGMIIAEPVRELINPVFWIKMGLVIALILLSIWYQLRVRRSASVSPSPWRASGAVKAGAIGIIILWCVIMVAGRWIAYAPV